MIFNAGVVDSTARAINVFTGEEVWTDSLPGSSTATPMSYVSPKTGKQYVIVTVADGGGALQLENAVDDLLDPPEPPAVAPNAPVQGTEPAVPEGEEPPPEDPDA